MPSPVNCFLVLLLFAFSTACSQKQQADLMVTNATIYTVDSNFSTAEAMVVTNGKIIATGTLKHLNEQYSPAETIDANHKFIYPGFNDAHCHFLAYGKGLNECNLTGSTSWKDILDSLQAFAIKHKESWLTGRGWDQNDWTDKAFPTNEQLNILFPDRPVLLTRIDGHAAIVNAKALQLAAINSTQKITGGDIVVANGNSTGLLIDNAIELVERIIPKPTKNELKKYLMDAQAMCFAAGLTSVQDCGLDATEVLLIKELDEQKQLLMRMYVMLSDKKDNYDWAFKNGKIKTDKFTVSAFKLYADGALGSRGACLLEPYSDRPNHYGFLLNKINYYDSIFPVIAANGWQACTHAIGDSANRIILNMYGRILARQTDKRWRIEHAQVINENDFDLFGKHNIIPSVQPTHATSDMYWAKDRLGTEREKGAYAYQSLLKQNGWLPLGTDFPVEGINPISTFYASVVRKDANGFPDNGYQPTDALTREQAVRGMTIWAAKSAFEEKEKGSLEKDKYADFVILDKDLMNVPANEILSIKVLMTVSGGKKVYEAPSR